MAWISPLLFSLLLVSAVYLFTRRIQSIRKLIALGRPDLPTDQPARRWGQVFRLALGQQKMFRNTPVALLHLIIYVGFIIINIEVVEIILDGLTGSHRMFLASLGDYYKLLIHSFEWLALGVLIACFFFLIRRNLMAIPRLQSPDLTNWPSRDATIILVTEIVLMSLFLTMNAADTLLQKKEVGHYAHAITGPFVISQYLHPLLNGISNSGLILLERACWWIHIIGIFAFLNYLPYSKHLHILLAFPNAYYAPLDPVGKMSNMPSIQQEVLLAMNPEATASETATTPPAARFGAKDVHDLGQKNLLDAFSCTECGRCSAACPAQHTGKLLSPRKIMMQTRDRLENLKSLPTNQESDNKTLLHDYITVEELRACTTCQACVQECPVSINPLDIILQLRRYLVMEESNAPGEWTSMFGNVENNFAPWKFSPEERDSWTK